MSNEFSGVTNFVARILKISAVIGFFRNVF